MSNMWLEIRSNAQCWCIRDKNNSFHENTHLRFTKYLSDHNSYIAVRLGFLEMFQDYWTDTRPDTCSKNVHRHVMPRPAPHHSTPAYVRCTNKL